MIDREKFKKALGKSAEDLSEEQITKLWTDQDQLAEAIFSMWIHKINQNNV